MQFNENRGIWYSPKFKDIKIKLRCHKVRTSFRRNYHLFYLIKSFLENLTLKKRKENIIDLILDDFNLSISGLFTNHFCTRKSTRSDFLLKERN